ncbi:hypothetical protein CR513_23696, partial [Mucuna pruriens]
MSINLDGKQKAEFVKELHAKVRANIEKRNEQYSKQANKGHVMTFDPGDCVWVHRRKEKLPTRRKYKLQPRGDGTFQVLERINDNAYKLDLSTAYGEEFDSRMNPFEEGRNDRIPTEKDKDKDNLCDTRDPMTRSKTKMMKQSVSSLSSGIKENLEQSESEAAPKWVTLLQVVVRVKFPISPRHAFTYFQDDPFSDPIFMTLLTEQGRRLAKREHSSQYADFDRMKPDSIILTPPPAVRCRLPSIEIPPSIKTESALEVKIVIFVNLLRLNTLAPPQRSLWKAEFTIHESIYFMYRYNGRSVQSKERSTCIKGMQELVKSDCGIQNINHLMHTSHSCSCSIPLVVHGASVRCLVNRGGVGLEFGKPESEPSLSRLYRRPTLFDSSPSPMSLSKAESESSQSETESAFYVPLLALVLFDKATMIKQRYQTDSNIQEEAEIDLTNLEEAETESNHQPKVGFDSSYSKSKQAEAKSNSGQSSPHLNRVGQLIPVVVNQFYPPQSPPTELKPLPKHFKHAYLDDLKVEVAECIKEAQEDNWADVSRLSWNKSLLVYAQDLIGGGSLTYKAAAAKAESDYPGRSQERTEIIYPISDNQWESSVQVVPKKFRMTIIKSQHNKMVLTRIQNSWRVCIDYKKLNQAIRKDHFPLPFID